MGFWSRKSQPIEYKVKSGLVIRVVKNKSNGAFSPHVNTHSMGLAFETEDRASEFAEIVAEYLKRYT
jgi:hypothetical protein